MSHDHDLDPQRDHQTTSSTTSDADSTAPGRASRSAQLRRSDSPTMSGILMRKASGAVGADPEQAVAQASGSSGGALPDDLRTKFESSLGVDLSGVRVHTGSESAQATNAVGAHAYAMGNDIHFAAGQYDPSSEQGQHLIAHEVAHTVQQRGAPATRQNKLAVSSPGDAAEVEADHAAAAMVAGRPAVISSMPSSGILHRSASGASAPAEAPSTGVSASGKISTTKTEFSVKLEPKAPFKNSYVHGEVGLSVSGSVEVAYPNALPGAPEVEMSGTVDKTGAQKASSEGSLPAAKRTLWEKKIKAGAEKGVVEQLADKLDISKIEIQPFGKLGGDQTTGPDGKTKHEAGYKIGSTVTAHFAGGGKPATFTGNLIGVKLGEKPSFEGPSAAVDVPGFQYKVPRELDGKDVTATGTLDVSGTATLKPAWSEKLAEEATKKLFEKAGEKAVEKVAEGAVEAATETATAEASAASALNTALMAEVAGFGAIAVSMGAAFVIGANQVTEIKEYEARARAAIAGYVNGAMTALGCSGGGKGDPQYVIRGMAAYAGKPAQMMAAAKSKLPAGHNFSDADIMAQLKEKIVAQQTTIREKIESEAKPTLTKQFVEQYYRDNKGWLFQTEDRRDAEHIATRLGQPDIRLDENGNAYELED